MVRFFVDYTAFEEKEKRGETTFRVKPIRKAYILNGVPEEKVCQLQKIIMSMTVSKTNKNRFNDPSISKEWKMSIKESFPVYSWIFYRLEADRDYFESIVTRDLIPLGNIMEDIFAVYFGLVIHYPYSTEHWNRQNTHLQPPMPLAHREGFGMRPNNPFILNGGGNLGAQPPPLMFRPPTGFGGFGAQPSTILNNSFFPRQPQFVDTQTINRLAEDLHQDSKREHPDDSDDSIDSVYSDDNSGVADSGKLRPFKRQRPNSHQDDNHSQSNEFVPISPLSNQNDNNTDNDVNNDDIDIDNNYDDNYDEDLNDWLNQGPLFVPPQTLDFDNPDVQGENFNRCIGPVYGFNPDDCKCKEVDVDDNSDSDDGDDEHDY